jgi:hypothetical protein
MKPTFRLEAGKCTLFGKMFARPEAGTPNQVASVEPY